MCQLYSDLRRSTDLKVVEYPEEKYSQFEDIGCANTSNFRSKLNEQAELTSTYSILYADMFIEREPKIGLISGGGECWIKTQTAEFRCTDHTQA